MFQTLFMIYLQWGLPGLEPTGYSKCVVDCADGDDDDCTCDFVPPLIVTCIPIAMIVFDTFLLKLCDAAARRDETTLLLETTVTRGEDE